MSGLTSKKYVRPARSMSGFAVEHGDATGGIDCGFGWFASGVVQQT